MAKPFPDLAARPIPRQTDARAAKAAYRAVPIDAGAPAHAEPLVALRGIVTRPHYARADNPPYWAAVPGAPETLWLRAGAAARLGAVDARLRAGGVRLRVLDAWRPRAVQAYFHDVWTPTALRARHPDWDAACIAAEVARYWSAPTTDPAAPTPHETGGAVDLMLELLDGEPLWFGCLFDEVGALAHSDHFETAARLGFSDAEAQTNRRILHWAMREAGFAAHPDEWWHYCYGDQMWAALTGAPAALYGLCAPASESPGVYGERQGSSR